MSDVLNLEKGNLSKVFIKFAIPSIVGLLIVSMQTIIDGMFVSKAIGPVGLAAVNISVPLLITITSIALMIVCGGLVIAGVAKGAKNETLARGYTTLTILILAVTIVVVSILLLFNIDGVCRFLGANEEVFPYVKSYLTAMIIGSFFYVSPIFTEAFCRLINKPYLVFLSGGISLVVNVALDYLFLMKFGWGIESAALATCIASAVATFALAPFVEFEKIKGGLDDVKRIFFNGSSEMLTAVSAAFTTYIFNVILMNNIGTLGVAALTIVFYINMIVNFSIFGLAQALQPLIAYNVGARNYLNIKKLLKISLMIGGAIGLSVYVVVFITGESIINIFTDGNQELFLLAHTAAMYITVHYLFSFINIIAGSFHTAIERPFESALIGLCRSIIFVLIPLFTLPALIGDRGIWLSMPIAEVLCLCVSIPLIIVSMKRLRTKMNI